MIRAVCAAALTLCGGVAGFYMGSGMNEETAMMLFGGLVMGVGCIVYAVERRNAEKK